MATNGDRVQSISIIIADVKQKVAHIVFDMSCDECLKTSSNWLKHNIDIQIRIQE